MLTSSIVAAAGLILAVSVNAQTTTAPAPSASGSPTSSSAKPSSTVNYIDISVGAELHKFVPDQVTAKVGDVIRFGFYPGGHRVARAEFKQPCIPYENTGANKRGFWSGIFNPQVITNPPPYYEVRVNDTDPIFFYCGAPGSCNQYGMVGVVNPTSEMTLDIQKAYAANSTLQFVPGEPFPSETLSPTTTPTSTPTPGSGTTGGQNDSAESSNSGGSSLSAGAIAGIAIGGAAVLILGAGLIYMCGRRGGSEWAYRKSLQGGHMPPGAINGGMAEARFHDPKSPGQQTMASFPNGDRDPYRFSAQTVQAPLTGQYPGTPPPPLSPGMHGYGAYPSPVAPSTHYSSMGDAASHGHASGYYAAPQPIPSPQFQSPPSELPGADHPTPGHSPPPQYPKSDQTLGAVGGHYPSSDTK